MDMDQAIQKMGKGLQSQDPNNISGNKSMIMLSNKEENLPPQDLSSVGKPLRDKVVHAYNRTLKMFIGSVHVDLKTIHVQPDDSSANPAQGSQTLSKAQYKYHTVSTILYPARWLVNQGFSYSPRINVVGYFLWELKIKVTYAVPDDSLVFEFCKVGDVSGLKRLFANKQASTKDVDSLGRTPIYFAAQNHQVETCRFLIHAGADMTLRVFQTRRKGAYPWSPLLAAAHPYKERKSTLTNAFDTLRLFGDYMDFSTSPSDGWKVI